eukprot:TRINITY_DN1317_c0_g1_i1.p1 TRINITY_DN1317_c0_g1~~TRINITY_DN1317_c0_g1_i1.p1  ORF type:complete len:1017 (+),score=261.99 TRINITY_DN1317_c0_g1_i1:71-3052(+)
MASNGPLGLRTPADSRDLLSIAPVYCRMRETMSGLEFVWEKGRVATAHLRHPLGTSNYCIPSGRPWRVVRSARTNVRRATSSAYGDVIVRRVVVSSGKIQAHDVSGSERDTIASLWDNRYEAGEDADADEEQDQEADEEQDAEAEDDEEREAEAAEEGASGEGAQEGGARGLWKAAMEAPWGVSIPFRGELVPIPLAVFISAGLLIAVVLSAVAGTFLSRKEDEKPLSKDGDAQRPATTRPVGLPLPELGFASALPMTSLEDDTSKYYPTWEEAMGDAREAAALRARRDRGSSLRGFGIGQGRGGPSGDHLDASLNPDSTLQWDPMGLREDTSDATNGAPRMAQSGSFRDVQSQRYGTKRMREGRGEVRVMGERGQGSNDYILVEQNEDEDVQFEEAELLQLREQLTAVLRERMAELQEKQAEERGAMREAAQAEVRQLREEQQQQAEGIGNLETQVAQLHSQLTAVKDLARRLLDEKAVRDGEAEELRRKNEEAAAAYEDTLAQKEALYKRAVEEAEEAAEQAARDAEAERLALNEALLETRSQRRDLRAALEVRQTQLQVLEERVTEEEEKRDALAKELRVAVGEAQALSASCDELAASLELALKDKDKVLSDKNVTLERLTEVEAELRHVRTALEDEVAKLVDAEARSNEKMVALGVKERDVESALEEVKEMRRESEIIMAELMAREAERTKVREEWEERKREREEELKWLQVTAGEATIVAREVSDVKAQLQRYKWQVEQGTFPHPMPSPADFEAYTARTEEASTSESARVAAEEFSLVREQLVDTALSQQKALVELGDQMAGIPELVLQLEASEARAKAAEQQLLEEQEVSKRSAARLEAELAEATAQLADSERVWEEEVAAVKERLWNEAKELRRQLEERVEKAAGEAKLDAAQTQIQELQGHLAEQARKLELFRRQAEAALAERDRKLEELEAQYARDLQASKDALTLSSRVPESTTEETIEEGSSTKPTSDISGYKDEKKEETPL